MGICLLLLRSQAFVMTIHLHPTDCQSTLVRPKEEPPASIFVRFFRFIAEWFIQPIQNYLGLRMQLIFPKVSSGGFLGQVSASLIQMTHRRPFSDPIKKEKEAAWVKALDEERNLTVRQAVLPKFRTKPVSVLPVEFSRLDGELLSEKIVELSWIGEKDQVYDLIVLDSTKWSLNPATEDLALIRLNDALRIGLYPGETIEVEEEKNPICEDYLPIPFKDMRKFKKGEELRFNLKSGSPGCCYCLSSKQDRQEAVRFSFIIEIRDLEKSEEIRKQAEKTSIRKLVELLQAFFDDPFFDQVRKRLDMKEEMENDVDKRTA